MLMSDKKECLVFDANFFICMLQIRARNILGNLEKAAKELGYEYYISDIVFDEIKAPHTYKDKLKEILNVVEVLPIEIDDVKNDLIQYNIRFPAQDPDLSLVYIAKKLMDEKEPAPIHLVTDDFKLVKNTSLLYKGKLNILSLSSFLLKTQRTTSNSQLRRYFKDIWKRSLNYTLSYMIERSKTYPAEQKITWLIEKAITVTEDSILTQDVELENPDVGMRFEIGASRYLEEINIADKARLLRDNVVVYDGRIESLRRVKEVVNNISRAQECGISLENFNDIKEGDIIETYNLKEIPQEL